MITGKPPYFLFISSVVSKKVKQIKNKNSTEDFIKFPISAEKVKKGRLEDEKETNGIFKD